MRNPCASVVLSILILAAGITSISGCGGSDAGGSGTGTPTTRNTGRDTAVMTNRRSIRRIVAAASSGGNSVRAVFGGLHLVAAPDSVLGPLVNRLHDSWRIAQMAPGHCTGEPAFAALQRAYGRDYLYAGLGEQITLP